MPFGFFFDPRYLLFALPAMALVLFAQWRVRSAYARYSEVRNAYGLTGAEAARRLLDWAGLRHIPVQIVPGDLSDNYDPRSKVLHLSQGVAHTPSVAALGIAAHEIGHALQDAQAYVPLRARAAIVPAANLGTSLGFWIFFLGLLIHPLHILAWVGVGLFSIAVLFTLITLPVELNASRRARTLLSSSGLASPTEMDGVSAVLNAAALTYVAALAQALATLLYFLDVLGVFSSNQRR
ncbi:MAG TPA: zinc metallopeptidase [Chloroflexota bacterium]|nr:zinc metallopeptidase [Chloroflexota bacterium]